MDENGMMMTEEHSVPQVLSFFLQERVWRAIPAAADQIVMREISIVNISKKKGGKQNFRIGITPNSFLFLSLALAG